MLRKNIPAYLIIHHTGGTDAQPLADSSNYTVKQCDADHKIRFPSMRSSTGYYVGYHYFIDKKGVVTQTRKDDEEGAHTVGKNIESIGICLAGNFDATIPTKEQETSLKGLITSKMALYSIPLSKVVPHRTFASKTCFGRNLTDTWAQDLFTKQSVPTIEDSSEDACKVFLQKQNVSYLSQFLDFMFKLIRNK